MLALGGNVGDKALSLRRALRAIASEPGIELTAVSRLYRTAPWGKTDQDWFVNACALGLTRLPPEALLERIKALEIELGRVSTERWGPRVIDIDLIAYGDISLKTERLTLPHPELFNRAFVLVPLAEIAPDLVIAGACGWAKRPRGWGRRPPRSFRSIDRARVRFALASVARTPLDWRQ